MASPETSDQVTTRTYVRVIVVEIVTVTLLWVAQRIFG